MTVDVATKVKKKPASTTKKATVAEPEKDPRSFGYCPGCGHERPLAPSGVMGLHRDFLGGVAFVCSGVGSDPSPEDGPSPDDAATVAQSAAGQGSPRTIWSG